MHLCLFAVKLDYFEYNAVSVRRCDVINSVGDLLGGVNASSRFLTEVRDIVLTVTVRHVRQYNGRAYRVDGNARSVQLQRQTARQPYYRVFAHCVNAFAASALDSPN